MKMTALACASCLLVSTYSVASAQAEQPQQPAKVHSLHAPTGSAANMPCRVNPDRNAGNQGQKTGQPPMGDQDQTGSIASDSSGSNSGGSARVDGTLTSKLNRCGDVLQPPAQGDTDMVQPAPDVGTTPVIPPSAVPPQRDKQ